MDEGLPAGFGYLTIRQSHLSKHQPVIMSYTNLPVFDPANVTSLPIGYALVFKNRLNDIVRGSVSKVAL